MPNSQSTFTQRWYKTALIASILMGVAGVVILTPHIIMGVIEGPPCRNDHLLRVENVRLYGDPILERIAKYRTTHGVYPHSLADMYRDGELFPTPDIGSGVWEYSSYSDGFCLSIGCPPDQYPNVHYCTSSGEWRQDF